MSQLPAGRLLSTGLWVSAHLMSKTLPAFCPALSLQGGLLRTQLGLVPAGEGAGFSAWYKILGDWTSSSSPITEPAVHTASTWATSLIRWPLPGWAQVPEHLDGVAVGLVSLAWGARSPPLPGTEGATPQARPSSSPGNRLARLGGFPPG